MTTSGTRLRPRGDRIAALIVQGQDEGTTKANRLSKVSKRSPIVATESLRHNGQR